MSSGSCLRCGRPVPERLLGGLCAHCVGQAALAAITDPPRRVGEYELLHELGRGGMGVVYLARQASLDRLVAVKMLLAGPFGGAAAEQRLLHEAREAARLRHPGIVAVHEVGQHEGRPFYSMDFIEGDDLAARAQRRRFTPRESAELVLKLAAAVEHAHAAGVLHRDLKPTNILCDAAGEPHIADFGLAAPLDGDGWLTGVGQVLGSPSFMAPEQLEGRASVAADLYGLGAILYFLLAGRPPFAAAKLADLLAAVAQGDPAPLRSLDASIPRDLETIVAKCLSRDPASRYPRAAALAADLRRWAEGKPITARPAGGVERAWRWTRRNPALASSLAAIAISLTAGAAVGLWQWQRAETAAAAAQLEAYAANLRVASDALVSGDLGQALRQLEACPTERREIAWGLLRAQAQGEQEAVIGSAQWTVTQIAVSPDGVFAATCGQADPVRLWNLNTRELVTTLPGTEYGWTVEFSPDGRHLITADRVVRVWDLASRSIAREFAGRGAALSPDGRTLAVVAASRFWADGPQGAVSFHDFATGELQRTLPVAARVLAWSPDQRMVATGDDEGMVRCWTVATGAASPAVRRASGPVWSLAFSPDGTRLAASGWAPEVSVWSMTDEGALPQRLNCVTGTWAAEFSPDGATLAVASSDRQVHLWDPATGRRHRILRGHHNEVWSLAWASDGSLLSSGRDPRLLRWKPAETERRATIRHDYDDYFVFWLPEDRLATVVVAGGGRDDHAQIAEVSGSKPALAFPGEVPLGYDADRAELFLQHWDGRLLVRSAANPASAVVRPWLLQAGEVAQSQPRINEHGGLGWWFLEDHSLVVHRLADGARVARVDLKLKETPRTAALAATGRWFAWGHASTELFLLDLRSGERRQLAGHRYEVSDLCFTRDDSLLLSGGVDGFLFGWDPESGGRRFELGPQLTSVGRLTLSPDETVLATTEPGRGVHLWLLSLRREVGFFPQADELSDSWLRFSPDGRWLGTRRSSGEIQLLPVAAPAAKYTR